MPKIPKNMDMEKKKKKKLDKIDWIKQLNYKNQMMLLQPQDHKNGTTYTIPKGIYYLQIPIKI